jgi:hypothetical protein
VCFPSRVSVRGTTGILPNNRSMSYESLSAKIGERTFNEETKRHSPESGGAIENGPQSDQYASEEQWNVLACGARRIDTASSLSLHWQAIGRAACRKRVELSRDGKLDWNLLLRAITPDHPLNTSAYAIRNCTCSTCCELAEVRDGLVEFILSNGCRCPLFLGGCKSNLSTKPQHTISEFFAFQVVGLFHKLPGIFVVPMLQVAL